MQEESDERQQTTEQILLIAQNAEKICNRLTDDCFNNIEDLQQKTGGLETEVANLKTHLDDRISRHLAVKGDRSFNTSNSKSDLKTLEEKINKRVVQSISELGDLMKTQARKTKKVNDRIGDLEAKVFGRVTVQTKKQQQTSTARLNSSKLSDKRS